MLICSNGSEYEKLDYLVEGIKKMFRWPSS